MAETVQTQLLREILAVLKRTETLIRAQTEDMGLEADDKCPKCGSTDLVEIGPVMGENGPHMKCMKCGARMEVVNG